MNNNFSINFPEDSRYISFKDGNNFNILKKCNDGTYEKLITIEGHKIVSVEYVNNGFAILFWDDELKKELSLYNECGYQIDSREGIFMFHLIGNGIYQYYDKKDKSTILYDLNQNKIKTLDIRRELKSSLIEKNMNNLEIMDVMIYGSGYDKNLIFEIILSMDYRLYGSIHLDSNKQYDHMFEFYPFVMINNNINKLEFFNNNYDVNNITTCFKDLMYVEHYFDKITNLDFIKNLDNLMAMKKESNEEIKEKVHKLMKKKNPNDSY